LRRNSHGLEVIEDYYRTAPLVVAAVRAGPDAHAAWRQIYAELVEPVVSLVGVGQFDEAADLALSRYDVIKRRYGVD
jgi:hypothetical protein